MPTTPGSEIGDRTSRHDRTTSGQRSYGICLFSRELLLWCCCDDTWIITLHTKLWSTSVSEEAKQIKRDVVVGRKSYAKTRQKKQRVRLLRCLVGWFVRGMHEQWIGRKKKSRCGNRNRVELGTDTRAMWALKSNRGVYSTACATQAANKWLQNRQVLPRVHWDQMQTRSFSRLGSTSKKQDDVAMMLQFNYNTTAIRLEA